MHSYLLPAGRRNKRITIQSPSTTLDELGQPVAGWVDFAVDISASVEDISGREFIAAGAVQNSVTTKIVILARPGVVEKMRVMHGTTAYNVEAVLRQDDRSLLLVCSMV